MTTQQKSFWRELKDESPECIMALAPMADVTDNPFRRILSEIGPPTVYWNEFVAADGLAHPEARPKLERLLTYEEDQRPIVAQIFSGDAENCRSAAVLCAEHGFDGIDINMGCPARNIIKQVSGSELAKIEHRDRVREIIEQTRIGAGQVPVSVKTRLGFGEIDMSWIEFLLEMKLPVLTLHLRTKREMSKVPAHWELMTEIREMRDRISPETLLIGNGDVVSIEQGRELCLKHGIDGVMVGRGLFNNPWLFNQSINIEEVTIQERVDLALRHTRYFIEENTINGEMVKNFNLMKKFYKVYINGFPGAKELRIDMMSAKEYEEVEGVCRAFVSKL